MTRSLLSVDESRERVGCVPLMRTGGNVFTLPTVALRFTFGYFDRFILFGWIIHIFHIFRIIWKLMLPAHQILSVVLNRFY